MVAVALRDPHEGVVPEVARVRRRGARRLRGSGGCGRDRGRSGGRGGDGLGILRDIHRRSGDRDVREDAVLVLARVGHVPGHTALMRVGLEDGAQDGGGVGAAVHLERDGSGRGDERSGLERLLPAQPEHDGFVALGALHQAGRQESLRLSRDLCELGKLFGDFGVLFDERCHDCLSTWVRQPHHTRFPRRSSILPR